MTYYNKLSASELEKLEEDFVKFLVLNGITGDDWKKMQINSPENANSMIDQFSEVVFEASLRKAQFLLMVDEHAVRSFQCNEKKIIMISLLFKGEGDFNFHNVDDLQTALSDSTLQLEIGSANKAYTKKREHELYDMINSGCKITDGKVYKLLSMYWADLQSSQN